MSRYKIKGNPTVKPGGVVERLTVAGFIAAFSMATVRNHNHALGARTAALAPILKIERFIDGFSFLDLNVSIRTSCHPSIA